MMVSMYIETRPQPLDHPPSSSESPSATAAASRSEPSPTSPCPPTPSTRCAASSAASNSYGPTTPSPASEGLPHGHVAAVLATVPQARTSPPCSPAAPAASDSTSSSHCSSPASDAQSRARTARALTPETEPSPRSARCSTSAPSTRRSCAGGTGSSSGRRPSSAPRQAPPPGTHPGALRPDLQLRREDALRTRPARPQPRPQEGHAAASSGCSHRRRVSGRRRGLRGSTSDPNTVAAQVDKIRTRFGRHRVVLVGDRGMLTAARIREDLAEVDGLRGSPRCARRIRKLRGRRNRHAVRCSTNATSPRSPARSSPASG